MDNKQNDTEKAIITLGKFFKVFALIVTILIIALIVYLMSHADPKVSHKIFENYHYALRITPYAFIISLS